MSIALTTGGLLTSISVNEKTDQIDEDVCKKHLVTIQILKEMMAKFEVDA